ncbi:MAG: ribonuclease III [Eubacterium sp.]|uniref:ribonuclease III n=1 Tax=Eubacterium sp. F2 TaxID=3381348 RepID=UPI0039082AF5|nr:ribonuclease III [Eubacterium sp.]MCI2197793.1 ribonuclease III [Eubacterium sp.]
MNEQEFEEILQYQYHDIRLLKRALTHSSWCKEHHRPPMECNERLEFLGDAFLDAIIGTELFTRLDHSNEGKLTKLRALVVCEKALAEVGRKLNIGEYLYLGHGEEMTGGRTRESIIADAVEAVIASVFLDSDYEHVRDFVLREFRPLVDLALEGKLYSDYKTQVQEILQKNGTEPEIRYVLDRETGPDHDKTFYVHMLCNGQKMGSGSGKSKKEAEQNAAKASLEEGYVENVL